jgi:hypothetical protein
MSNTQDSNAHRKFQVLVGVDGDFDLFDSFNSFFDAFAAGHKFHSIKIVDSYDSLVVYENQVSLPSPKAVGKS